MGQVSRPTLKSDAENVVKRIEGVEYVDNQIEVLPTSPNDDRLRLALFQAIYGDPSLQKYALGDLALAKSNSAKHFRTTGTGLSTGCAIWIY
jgi:hypothetical protein